MKKLSKILFSALAMWCLFLFVRYKPWEAWIGRSSISDTLLASLVAVVLIGLAVCAVLLIIGRKGARIWFIVFNVLYLGLGAYLTMFTWNFWLWHTPTFVERVRASSGAFLLGVIMPIAVVIYFIKAEKKN
jgi:hypothetical protein